MAQAFDAYHQWLGIPAAEQPPNYYRLLSVPPFETDPAVIENAADQRMAHLRVFQTGRHSKISQRLLNEVATARVTLLSAEKKAAYDAQLRAELRQRKIPDGPPAQQPPLALGAPTPAGATKPPPAPTVELELPVRELGEYRLTEKLGEGGMGAVYKGVHTKLGREVAVKVLTTARLGSERAVARFEREMLAVGRLDHPNIVRAYDAREIEGTRFLVMELVDGLDLGDVLRHTGPLPVADACEVTRQAALGLQCAHESELVHRDVKPGNLMVASAGQVKILDLGLARFEAGRPGEEMTSTGTALGTLDYMAPEQASGGRQIDIRADIYSLGCTLYKLLTGRAPFDQPRYAGVMEKVVAHAKHSPPALSRFRRDVPKEIVAILNRMMAKDPARRFQTPAEVADAVGPFCVGADPAGLLARARKQPPQAAPSRALENTQGRLSSSLTNFLQAITPGRRGAERPRPAPPGRRQLALGAAAAVTVAVLAAALVWVLRSPGPTDDPVAVAPVPDRPGAREPGALVLRLSEEERAGTELRVDNSPVAVPDSAPWEIARPAGAYRVRLLREGYEPYETSIRIEPGEKVSLKPEWVAESALVLAWPVHQRADARLHVDGDRVPLPTGAGEPDELHVAARPGMKQVWAERRGYVPFSATVELGRGEQLRVPVEWEPASGPAMEEVAARPEQEPPPPEPEREPEPTPQPEREPEPEPAGPTPEELAALEALEAAEAQWREATRASAEKAAAWDFAGALAALDEVRFDDEALAARLARRKDELERMAALKARMIARINEADPPLKKADLMLRGFAGELTGADEQAITATLASGRDETLPWSELGSQAPARLLQLVVDKSSADDWLSAGVFALGIGDVDLAERLLARAGQMGVDIAPYRGPLAQAAFDAARELLEEGDFAKAAETLTAMERRHAGTQWLADREAAMAAAQTAAEHGIREAEAEQLYAEAVAYFENEQYFDVRPLVERLQAEYAGTEVVADTAREPSFAEMRNVTEDLGEFITVRQEGEADHRSIQEAISLAPPRSLIEIQDSAIYEERVVIPKDKERLTLRGAEGCWPIVKPQHSGHHTVLAVKAAGVTIERMVVTGITGRTNRPAVHAPAEPFTLRDAVLFSMNNPKLGGTLSAYSGSDIQRCFVAGHGRCRGDVAVTDSFFTESVHADGAASLHATNCVIAGAELDRNSHLSFCTIFEELNFTYEPNVIENSIVRRVSSKSENIRIEHSNLYDESPLSGPVKPGKGCFSAPPGFVHPDNFDYRLVPGSPCIGKASDGGDVGVRYTPEMIEILKLALELRARGIIEF